MLGGSLAPGSQAGELGKFPIRSGQADFQPFDLTQPTFLSCLCDPAPQVAADLDQLGGLGRVGPEERAAKAGEGSGFPQKTKVLSDLDPQVTART